MGASFKPAFDATMRNEGGYGNDPQDPGGETYRGIARKFHSKWEGWTTIDALDHDNPDNAMLEVPLLRAFGREATIIRRFD